ncbi:hypothetical protein EOE18_13725 [Novosphingobium umbonatum]|uniref:Uncharacterized protein n=1 Tax=Novosphingobium umbonatum TaxID=1908524 RepID=A0A437N1X2_9SPHN|nr:hypothetical protein [Novosphingobium umbonatum]RVU03913.1 hypothetical protein EOE18_13725 [Novosphingobium umbonatum]
MKYDIALQLSSIVALFEQHPVGFSVIAFFAFILLASQKDGLFSRYVALLQARADHHAALETRRIEVISMLENRRQPELPGMRNEGEDVP